MIEVPEGSTNQALFQIHNFLDTNARTLFLSLGCERNQKQVHNQTQPVSKK
jgi:hypothetical protein